MNIIIMFKFFSFSLERAKKCKSLIIHKNKSPALINKIATATIRRQHNISFGEIFYA